MKTRVLAIVPYAGMKDLMTEVASKRSDIDLHVEVGDMEKGVQVFRDSSSEKYDVVISRGGTCQLIRLQTDMPVIDVSISIYDVLSAITVVQSVPGGFALVGHASLTNCAKSLGRVMQCDFKTVTITAATNVREVLSNLAVQGVKNFICDMVTTSTAHEIGLNAMLVLSGKESISDAFDRAVSLAKSFNYVRRQSEMLKTIFAASNQNVFVYYPDGRFWFSTLSQEKETPMRRIIEKNFALFLERDGYCLETAEQTVLHTFRAHHMEAFYQPYVMIFHQKRELFSDEEDGSVFLYHSSSERFPQLFTAISTGTGNLRERITSFAKTGAPIIILGEDGTEKSQIAALLFKEGPYRDNHFYVIHCALMGQRKWNYLFKSTESPLFDMGSAVFFKDVDQLKDSQLEELLEFLEQGAMTKSLQFIFSIDASSRLRQKTGKVINDCLHGLVLDVLPLRERREDIPTMAIMYLNQLNKEYGKGIIGFEKDAMDLLANYSWPENIRQFKRVLRQASAISEGNYISASVLQSALKPEHDIHLREPDSDTDTATINICRTMAEIEHDIVYAVLKKNNMNQSKAAKQLNLSRTTIWRMLQ